MALKIDSSNLFARKYLKLRRDGIQFLGDAGIGFARNFTFRQIDYVLLSSDGVLSFQVGAEVFSIETRPDKPRHQEAIAALLDGLEQTRASTGSAVRYS